MNKSFTKIFVFTTLATVAGMIIVLEFDYFYFPSFGPQNLTDLEITLERTPCYGTCPVYSITLYGNGTVIYEGKRYVKTEGIHVYTIQNERVSELVRFFYKIDYFSLDDSYTSRVTDLPTTITSLKIENKTKTVSNYGNYGPASLHELELKIDEITKSKSFWRD